ncbi:MAG: HEAT repeat domain-containing protein [Trichodesmium sp. MAG_R03]|nr:HEAT repeat domain-containing protein [Trichodesmium sp. MAG_R03]
MLDNKSTFLIITWLTFFCFSPTVSRAVIDNSSTGKFSNRTLRKIENLEQSHQINSLVPLYIAQDSDSKVKESQKSKKKKSNSSDSKVPKLIRSILKILGERKTLFILSIISVLVTGIVVFILLKLFDDHKPNNLDPEEISEGTLPDLETNYPELNSRNLSVSSENYSVDNTENSLDSFVPPLQEDLGENADVTISQNSSKLHHQDHEIEAETFSIVDSSDSIVHQENNNYDQKETQLNFSKATDKNYIVQDFNSNNTTQQNNYPLPQVNIIEQLINELQNFDPNKRHQAIWELGQKGDSRAIQPLVNLLIDSDSKQQSLILATLSEIGTRILKPITRALAISLQNDHGEVRKNAIRDLTRIYELITQATNLLQRAEYDPDPEVEKTAKWALKQLNRIHTK